MTQHIAAFLWSSGSAASMSATASMTITDSGGSETVTLAEGGHTLDAALTAWQTAANASGTLARTYTFDYSTATDQVVLTATGNFDVALAGNLAAALGFSGNQSGTSTYSSDEQVLTRFDDIKIEAGPPTDGGRVNLARYRHGRSESIAFGNHDIFEMRLWLTDAQIADFAGSYCATGKVRISVDDGNASAFSLANTGGYLDGWIVSASRPTPSGISEEWWTLPIVVAAAR